MRKFMRKNYNAIMLVCGLTIGAIMLTQENPNTTLMAVAVVLILIPILNYLGR